MFLNKNIICSRKNFTIDYNLLKQCLNYNRLGKRKSILTQKRNCIIIPQFLDQKIKIYNGKTYIPVLIKENMFGHKLGEFSYTRKLKTQKQLKKRSLLKITTKK